MTNHINLTDANGQVYCCLRNRIVALDQKHQQHYCTGCRMYNGLAASGGVNCLWEDQRTDGGDLYITDPNREWIENQENRVQRLMADWEKGWEPSQIIPEDEPMGFGNEAEAAG